VLANSGDGRVGLWSVPSGELITAYAGVGGGSPADLSGDGTAVAFEVTSCGNIRLVDARTDRIIGAAGVASLNRYPGYCVVDLALTPDGKRLVTADYGFPPRLWDTSNRQVIGQFDHPGQVNVVRVSQDGRYLLSGGMDGTARLWDLETGGQLRYFPGNAGLPVVGLATSPDGRWVAVGGQDGTAIVTPLAIADLEASVCSRLKRDLTDAERAEWSIASTDATCP
jgi:WD40 repeat protein